MKAYDKAWLDAIMYVLNKEGIDTPEWLITKKLNENLKATIQTLYGNTRVINIRDSIRQGGVLSVAEYAVLMDEINKEIENEKIGITVDELNEIIGCLLWVDDVVLIAESAEQMQKMLDITNQIAGKYHIEFGEAKSNVMKIGGNKDKPEFKLGEMKLKYCDKYKYLGIIFNNKETLKDHIPHLKGKTEAAYQTILTIAGNRYFNQLEMSTIWTLFESIITAIITYGSDT